MATSAQNWKPVKKFEFLYHGTTSGNARSIRQHGLLSGSYLTTHPGIAAVEAAAQSTGYHPIMGGAMDIGDALYGTTTSKALKAAKRVQKRAERKKNPLLGANKRIGSWGMRSGTKDYPVVFAVKREGLKGFKSDLEYVGPADSSDWVPPHRRFSFILKKKVPASHIVRAIRGK